MRISTSMLYGMGVASMQERQQDLLRLQQQLSSGQRILAPSDDPVAAATALDLKQSQSLNRQYHANGDLAKSQLAREEGVLASVTTLLQDVRTLAVYAGNAALSQSDREALAVDVQGRYDELLALANDSNGNGQFLFSGYQGATRPFAQIAPGNVIYSGDDGQRQIQIGPARSVAINDSGEDVFRAIKTGNGTFTAAAGAANTGGGIIDSGVVTDPLAWKAAGNPRNFTIKFHVDNTATPPATTYDIVDNVNNVSLLTGAAPGAGPYLRTFTPGDSLALKSQVPPDTNPVAFDYGAMVTVDGVPGTGDTFTINASVNRDVFATLHDLVSALTTRNGTGTAAVASYHNALNAAMSGIDNALDNVLRIRAEAGARLNQVDTGQKASEDVGLQYDSRLSDLLDLDFAKAISDLNLQQTQLDAAQKSFLKVSSLNLFSML